MKWLFWRKTSAVAGKPRGMATLKCSNPKENQNINTSWGHQQPSTPTAFSHFSFYLETLWCSMILFHCFLSMNYDYYKALCTKKIRMPPIIWMIIRTYICIKILQHMNFFIPFIGKIQSFKNFLFTNLSLFENFTYVQVIKIQIMYK
jgi:hypothetical protein